MSSLILGVDAGNHRAKVAGPYGVDSFRTAICDWFERDVVEIHGDDDMEFEIGGRRGFAGSIAADEDIFGMGGALFGESKAHEDTKIRVLLAIHRYLAKYSPAERRLSIVVGQPIKTHKDAEKRLIQEMLIGRHEFVVNGEQQRFTIENVGVAPEGSGAFFSNPQTGTVRIIDVGSGTINAATIIDNRHINNASGTFNFGTETVGDAVDLAAIARGIVQATTRLKWRSSDVVYVCGGVANDILTYLVAHYPNARVMTPQLRMSNGGISLLEPVYANAVGNYEIARMTYS